MVQKLLDSSQKILILHQFHYVQENFISSHFMSADNMKRTGFNGYVYDFNVDYNAIAVDDFVEIHKYLMKKITYVIKMFEFVKKVFFAGLLSLENYQEKIYDGVYFGIVTNLQVQCTNCNSTANRLHQRLFLEYDLKTTISFMIF